MRMSNLLSATALAGALLFAPAAAFAQTDSSVPKKDKQETSAAESGDQTDTITVVGSRIRRTQFNLADSIQVITRDESTQAGFSSTAGVLQSTQITGGTSQINNSYGGFVTAGGPGANTLSLRGLGTTRSLILLNGRRVSPSGTRGQVGAVDLNTLPNIAVERIEVLNSGASSIYGSDAVTGVVNLLTRSKVRGFELEGQINAPQLGGGYEKRVSAIFGAGTDRFDFMASLEYYKRDEVQLGQRDWATCQLDNRKLAGGEINGAGSATSLDPYTGQPKCYPTGLTGQGGVTINTLGTRNYTGSTVAKGPGVASNYTGTCNRFRPNAAVTTGALPGYECVGGGTLSLATRDTFPQSLLSTSLVSPAEIYNGYAQGSYKLEALGDAELYAELIVSRRKSSQTGSRQLVIDYAQGSLLLPTLFRNDTFLAAQAGGITGTTPIAARVFADYGTYGNRQTSDYARAAAGIRGNLFGGWRYDASVSKSWSDGTYTSDLVLTSRLAQSLDVVQNANGTFSCRNTLGNCVAAPALSAAVIGGQFPADWKNWITTAVTGVTKYRETIFNLSLDGPLFQLPGGAAQAAIGVERRTMSIDDTPSTESINNNLYNFTASSITRGSDAVSEAFGELELPVFKNTPFFHTLTFNASGRYTNYRSYGSEWTYKVGGIWEPVKFLGVRGSYNTSYRAPALFEQFLGATSGFLSNQSDPCNNWGSLDPTSPRAKNCASLGIPSDFQATTSITSNQVGGASSGLKAETSKSWTAGVILQPDFGSAGKLQVSADYFNLKIDNGISQLGAATVLSQCYDRPDFPNFSLCNLIRRNTSAPYGLTVTSGYVNISTTKASGWDFAVRYQVPVFTGQLRLNAALTKYNNRYSQTLPTDAIFDNIGSLNNPDWTGTFEGFYNINRLRFRYGVEWINKVYSSAAYAGLSDTARQTYVLEAPNYFLHSASTQFALEKFSLTVGVRNLFNTKPPYISSGVYNRIGNVPLYSGYDYNGRTFFVSTGIKF